MVWVEHVAGVRIQLKKKERNGIGIKRMIITKMMINDDDKNDDSNYNHYIGEGNMTMKH